MRSRHRHPLRYGGGCARALLRRAHGERRGGKLRRDRGRNLLLYRFPAGLRGSARYRVNCGETGSGSCPSCEDTPSLTEESPPCGCQAAIRALSALPVAAETLSVEKPGQPILRRGACPGQRFG